MKAKNKNHSGRPMAVINWPTSKFTFVDLCKVNKHVAPVTLRNALHRDELKRGHSEIVKLDEKANPTNKWGLGRKSTVYVQRTKLSSIKQQVAIHPKKTYTESAGEVVNSILHVAVEQLNNARDQFLAAKELFTKTAEGTQLSKAA